VSRASFLALHQLRGSCCFGLACVVVFRAPGRFSRLARVGAHRIFLLCRARGLPQRGVCRQRFVLCAQATCSAALPEIQSSAIVQVSDGVACCRLTSHPSGRLRRRLIPALGLMDILTFFAEIIKATAWPVAVVVIVLVFRKQLSVLLSRIRKGKFGSAELEFEQKVETLYEQVDPPQLPSPNVDTSSVSLVTANPRGAVLDAWNGIESAVHRLSYKLKISHSAVSRSVTAMVREIEQQGKLAPGDVALFSNLRMLRNQAAHESDFNPSPDSVVLFQRLAQDLKERLESSLSEP